eukprot:5885083-Ditylum_brightwellii.AAC.1
MVLNTPTQTQKFLLKFAFAPKFASPKVVNNDHHKCLCEKPLHGKFFCQQAEIPQVDMEQSHLWLRQAQLWPETEAAICAAKEQTMVTNHIWKEIFKQDVDPLCRLCRKENETISHIVSGCEMLAVLTLVYPPNHNIPVNPNWRKHKLIPAVLISNQVSVIYDLKQDVENAVEANRPDIVVLNEQECKALIIDVTVPMNINMIKAAA